MLMLAMCLAMSPAYSFMMVQDPIAIVTTVNNFVQTLTYYKNQIQKTYDEYRRIAKAAETLSKGTWQERLRAVADLANQMNSWDIFGSEVDLLLESIETGFDGTVDSYEQWGNVTDAWDKMQKTWKKLENQGQVKSADVFFEGLITGVSAIENLGKASAKLVETSAYAITDTVNPVIETFNSIEMRILMNKKEELIETRDKQKEIIEKQKEQLKKEQEKLEEYKNEYNNAVNNQEDSKADQTSELIAYKQSDINDLKEEIKKSEDSLQDINNQIKNINTTITQQQTNPEKNVWLEKTAEKVQGVLEAAKLTWLKDSWQEFAYVSDYGRN